MRIVRTTCSKNKESVELKLDEINELREVETIEYSMYLSPNEHRKIIDNVLDEYISKALDLEIDVYCGYQTLSRFVRCGTEIVNSTDAILLFSTSDRNKYDMLEELVRKFAIRITNLQ